MPRASGLSQAITKFAFPTFTLLYRRSSPFHFLYYHGSLPLPRSQPRRLANRVRIFFFPPRLRLRRVFAWYINGTFSVDRRNKRALPSWRFTWNDFCHTSRARRPFPSPTIVIGRIDILLSHRIQTSAPTLRSYHPCSWLVFRPDFFYRIRPACLARPSFGYIGFSGSTGVRCIYRARARNLTAKRLDFGFTPHRVAHDIRCTFRVRARVLSFSKYTSILDTPSFQRDSKKVKVSARERVANFVADTSERFLNVVLLLV